MRKVSAYNSIIIKVLDESLPEETIRVHHSDKPWITSNIKMQIKLVRKPLPVVISQPLVPASPDIV